MALLSTTPPGRIVQGDPFVAQLRRDDNGQPKMNADGTPSKQFFLAIAIPKTEPGWPAYKAGLDAEAKAAWPGGQHAAPAFANKIIDGDGVQKSGKNMGKKWSEYEGYAGCWVVKFSSQFAPKVWLNDNGFAEALPGSVKCGDYGRIEGECTTNKSTQTPGMYMHPIQVVRDREGPAIVSTAAPANTPQQAFGGTPAPTPTPPAASAPPPPASTPTAPPPSYDGFMQTPPPPPAGPTLTAAAAANGTYEAYLAAGWTEETLRSAGMLTA